MNARTSRLLRKYHVFTKISLKEIKKKYKDMNKRERRKYKELIKQSLRRKNEQ